MSSFQPGSFPPKGNCIEYRHVPIWSNKLMDYEKIFAESYERVLATKRDNKTFFEEFYDRFMASSEEVAKKFENVDMSRQREAIKESLFHMVDCFRTKKMNDNIIRMAVKHNKINLDIRPELYDVWLECLIDTVAIYDDEFDKFTELSWRIVMAIGISYMKFRYNNLLHKFC